MALLVLSLLFLPIALIFLLKVLMTVRRAKQKTSLRLPPSPPKLPIIGNLHQLGSLPHRSLQSLSQKHGPLMFLHLGQVPTLVVSSAKMAEEIMKTHDVVFADRPVTKATNQLLYGCINITFSPYGEYWREMKKLVMLEVLSLKRVSSYRNIREEEVGLMIERIFESKDGEVNISKLLILLTSAVITRSALGKKYGGDGKNEFGELAKELMSLLGQFFVADYLPLLGVVDVVRGLDARLMKAFHALDAFFDQVIVDHLIKRKENDGDVFDEKDFVDILLSLQNDHKMGSYLTKNNVKALILDMFVAATDTIGITTEWAMTELVRHPNVLKKAQEEVRQVVGKDSKVVEDHLPNLNYLKLVIKETMRLHPAAPLLAPRLSRADVTVEGYHIPAKTRVFINAWAIGRDPNSWENADHFIPERFANSSIDFKGQSFKFIPFGAGRRSCPGISFGTIALELALANLIYWFDWNLPRGLTTESLDMTEGLGITVHKKVPLRLVPKPHFPMIN